MKKVFLFAVAAMFLAAQAAPALAYEDKGSAKGSDYEHKSDENKAALQSVMTDYIETNSTNGVFTLVDPDTGKDRNMTYMDLHANVGMKNGLHYSCADFKDNDTGQIIDVDIFVDVEGDKPKVAEAVIHKVDGKKVGKAAKKAGSMKGSDHGHKGSGH